MSWIQQRAGTASGVLMMVVAWAVFLVVRFQFHAAVEPQRDGTARFGTLESDSGDWSSPPGFPGFGSGRAAAGSPALLVAGKQP